MLAYQKYIIIKFQPYFFIVSFIEKNRFPWSKFTEPKSGFRQFSMNHMHETEKLVSDNFWNLQGAHDRMIL